MQNVDSLLYNGILRYHSILTKKPTYVRGHCMHICLLVCLSVSDILFIFVSLPHLAPCSPAWPTVGLTSQSCMLRLLPSAEPTLIHQHDMS